MDGDERHRDVAIRHSGRPGKPQPHQHHPAIRMNTALRLGGERDGQVLGVVVLRLDMGGSRSSGGVNLEVPVDVLDVALTLDARVGVLCRQPHEANDTERTDVRGGTSAASGKHHLGIIGPRRVQLQ